MRGGWLDITERRGFRYGDREICRGEEGTRSELSLIIYACGVGEKERVGIVCGFVRISC